MEPKMKKKSLFYRKKINENGGTMMSRFPSWKLFYFPTVSVFSKRFMVSVQEDFFTFTRSIEMALGSD
jgi:hypothetical protein